MTLPLEKSSLLKNKQPDVSLGAFDGLVGALVEDGKFFITSANQNNIPLPPWGHNRALKLRADSRYGDDDPIQWPQPFNLNFPHYACIPHRISRPNDSIMWWTPTRDAFSSVGTSLITANGLGKLSSAAVMELNRIVSVELSRVERYLRATPPARIPPSLGPSVQMMKHSLARLKSIAMEFHQMEFQVRDVQRSWLEVVAMLDYMEVYRPRMDCTQGTVFADTPETAKTIGVFTADLRVAQDRFQAGLPYWLIRPVSAFADQNILHVCDPGYPHRINLNPHPFRRGALAEGRAGTDEKYNAIHQYARNLLQYPDPFGSDTITPDGVSSSSGTGLPFAMIPSSLGPIRTQHVKGGSKNDRGRKKPQISKPTNTHGAGRNKFEPINSPFMPLPITSWQSALKNVNTDPSRLDPSNRSNPHDGKYVFPEPGIFAGVKDDVGRNRYFHTWNNTKAFFIFRMFTTTAAAVPLTNQDWRTIMYGNLNGTLKGKKSQEGQQRFRDLFSNCLEQLGTSFDTFFPPLDTPPPPVSPSEGRRILWELSELNFRFELMALDKRASGTTSTVDAQSRQDIISRCFPGDVLIVELPQATKGLASLDWLERLPILLILRTLMRDWRGQKPTSLLLPDKSSLDLYTEYDVHLLEDAVARFYTQTFFNFFGRAAVIPTRLPVE